MRSELTRIHRYLWNAVHASLVYCLKEEDKHSISEGPSHRQFFKFNELICRTQKIFFYATIAIWICSTSHLCKFHGRFVWYCLIGDPGLNIYRLLRAYVWLWDTVGPVNYFLDRSRWDNLVQDLISMLTTWLANCLLVQLPCSEFLMGEV